MKKWLLYAVLAVLISLALLWSFRSEFGVNPPLPKAVASDNSSLAHLQVPDGYQISLFAQNLKAPRMLRVVSAGLLVSLPHEGRVMLLQDRDEDGLSDQRIQLVSDLNRPHGIDTKDGWLYIAETDGIGRIAFDEKTGVVNGDYQRILTGLVSGKWHWTRTLAVGPDGWLYVTAGSSCNVCIEEAPELAAMFRLRPDGSEKQIYASGLRNSVGFDWSPVDGEIYATDNGRDWLGDGFPPDELNRVVEGGFYGWPFANGNNVPDPDFGEGQQAKIDQSIAPVFEFRAHNAPLGIHFLRHQSNAAYQHAALVALHGSWNRSVKDGYKVVSLHWGAKGEIEEQDFVTGFLEGDVVHGRPVGIAETGDGTVYISDDYAGAIYRLIKEK